MARPDAVLLRCEFMEQPVKPPPSSLYFARSTAVSNATELLLRSGSKIGFPLLSRPDTDALNGTLVSVLFGVTVSFTGVDSPIARTGLEVVQESKRSTT